MTFKKAYFTALELLGYTDGFGASDDPALIRRILPISNAVYSDLFYALKGENICTVTDINSAVPLPDHIVNDCFIYGVAMWIAKTENDDDNRRLFANIYEYKRSMALRFSETTGIEDVIASGGKV